MWVFRVRRESGRGWERRLKRMMEMAMGRECRCSWWCWCWVDQVKMRMVWRGMRSLPLRRLGTWRCCVGAWLLAH